MNPFHDNATRSKAAAATAITVVLLLLWMLLADIDVSMLDDPARKWPPVDSSEIVFGGTFVRLGDLPRPMAQASRTKPAKSTSTEQPSHQGTDRTDAGERAAAAPDIVSSERPSPAKVTKKEPPAKTGPTKEELAERERIKREKEQAEKARRINSGMQGRFSKSQTSATANPGSPGGNSSTGALAGSPGYSLSGRTPEGWGRPASAHSGTIRIRVKVNRQGRVTEASYDGGTGSAAAQAGVRQSCLAAARQSRFSVDLNAPAEQTGYITWTFK